jgi:hypothetical protein
MDQVEKVDVRLHHRRLRQQMSQSGFLSGCFRTGPIEVVQLRLKGNFQLNNRQSSTVNLKSCMLIIINYIF